MTNYEGRQKDLGAKLNSYLTKLTGQEKDYYNALSQEDLAELKTVLSDINNVFTLRLTLTATKWLCKTFKIDNKTKNDIIKEIDSVKPNTNGFDIKIDKQKIVAEVKCVFPSNNSNEYLAAQRNGILDDAIKLINGKKQLSDTSDYHKFLFVINVGHRTDKAVRALLKPSKGTSDNDIRKNRHKIKEQIELLGNNSIEKFGKDKVYLKTLKLD
ncbi:hypothetical protein LJC68_03490 [Bacteroidales bacterium OttesenSCG-928-B11]|nr:hypothetical protein [Bacteroidales bacterium OttesenSCG-928-B11]